MNGERIVKTILVLILLISFGTVFGVIGYLAQKQYISFSIFPPKPFTVKSVREIDFFQVCRERRNEFKDFCFYLRKTEDPRPSKSYMDVTGDGNDEVRIILLSDSREAPNHIAIFQYKNNILSELLFEEWNWSVEGKDQFELSNKNGAYYYIYNPKTNKMEKAEEIGGAPNTIEEAGNFITSHNTDKETGINIDMTAPKELIKNKPNEVKIKFSNLGENSKYLTRGYLSVVNTIHYFFNDKKSSSCREDGDTMECAIEVVPQCNWQCKIPACNFPSDVVLQGGISIWKDNVEHGLGTGKVPLVVKASAPKEETCGNFIDDNCDEKFDGMDLQCDVFTIKAFKGEGVTNLARRAVSQYLEKTGSTELTKEQKIYAEDYIRKNLKKAPRVLKTGDKIDFPQSLIEEAVSKAKGLSSSDESSIGKYNDLIDYSAYKVISKSDSMEETNDVWSIGKSGVGLVYENIGAWKESTGSSSIVIYFNNKDITNVYYRVWATAKNKEDLHYFGTHTVEISSDGINWNKTDIHPDSCDDATKGTIGEGVYDVGDYCMNVKDYNKGNLYLKFDLIDASPGSSIVLVKKIRTNLDK